MKIKQNIAMKAYVSVKDLNQQKLSSGKVAKQVYELTNKLKPAYDFQIQEEQKIYASHPDFDPSIGGIRLENKTDEEKKLATENIKKIDTELKDLANVDFEIDFEKFDFDLAQNSVRISGEDIGNLDMFINFI